MRSIKLDFIPQRRQSPLAVLLLLLGAALLAGLIFWDQTVLQPQVDALEARLDEVRKVSSKRDDKPGVDKQLSADLSRAMAVSAELNLPWERLFAALEESAGRNVSLLTLEPDAVKHSLALTAEARNFRAMLEFYRQLQSQANLRDVNLHAHQTNEQDEERPIRFRITCSWQEAS
jgi:Tfp pilus assembly protein PilN